MSTPARPHLLLLLPLFGGCAPEKGPGPLAPPLLVLSDASVDFDELPWETSETRTIVAQNRGGEPLGIGAVRVGEEASDFSVAWDPCAVTCGGEPAACDASTGVAVLEAGCELPLTVTYAAETAGNAYDAVVVETVTDAGDDPAWHADPLHAYGVSYLQGRTVRREPTIFVSPRSYDFGFVYPGIEETPARFAVKNLGEADLTVSGVTLAEGCHAAYTPAPTLPVPFVLSPGDTTLIEVMFAPTDLDKAECQLEILSDDVAAPAMSVAIAGNQSGSPNSPPTVTIRSPLPGAAHANWQPLRVELYVTDADQPASSLTCTVDSLVLDGGRLARCTPADSAGRVFLDIAGETLPVGIDTLGVTVTDASGDSAFASVSVRFDTPSPADDDDGDGFGVPADCDENAKTVYPEAKELPDGLDNDCDGILDEGTVNFDDDLDGRAEVEGDCDDTLDTSYPGAPERGDQRDNDCDGLIDEGTLLFDDDGDGFAEDDCDDEDPGVYPAAPELCDTLDNDCDGFRDNAPEGCEPGVVIVGNVLQLEQTALLEGETIWAEVRTRTNDGARLTYVWTTSGGGAFVDPYTPRVTYTAGLDETSGSVVNDLYVVVTHPNGDEDWAAGTITVHDEATRLYE